MGRPRCRGIRNLLWPDLGEIPGIPGIDRVNVITAWQALARPEKAGKKVVIIGGGSVGAETAEFLLDDKKDVTLVEMLPEIDGDAEKVNRKVLLQSLGEKGVKIRVLTQATAIIWGRGGS